MKKRKILTGTLFINAISFAVVICLLLFFALFINHYSGFFLNSDDSSELVLSKLLSDEGGIVSENWYYSTELRVLNTQLIFAPLFHVFSDWNMVRTVGSTIILLLMVISGWLLGKAVGFDSATAALFCVPLLLPLSQDYFMIVMARSYYAPHITISLITFAILFFAAENRSRRKKGFLTAMAAILSFLAGLGGLRQLIILYIPLLLSSVFLFCTEYFQERGANAENLISEGKSTGLFGFFLKESVILLIFSGCGYLVNSRILSKRYSFASWNDMHFSSFSTSRLADIINGLLNSFGFRSGESVFSSALICSFTCFLLLLILCMAIYESFLDKGPGPEERILTVFFSAAAFLFTALYLFSDFGYADRYNLPIVVFALPAIFLYIKRKGNFLPRVPRNVLTLSLFLLLGVSGFITYRIPYFRTENEYNEVARALKEKGCSYGYSSYWHGNVLTELTDGAIEVHTWAPDINTVYNVNDAYPALQLKEHDSEIPERDLFCLLDSKQRSSFVGSMLDGSDVIYNSEEYTVYWFDSYDSFLGKMTAYDLDYSTDKGAYLIEGEAPEDIPAAEKNARILYKGGISYGPYVLLYPGSYEVTCKGDNLDILSYDAYSSAYSKNSGLFDISDSSESENEIKFIFSIDETTGATKSVETRFFNNTDQKARIDSIRIRKWNN